MLKNRMMGYAVAVATICLNYTVYYYIARHYQVSSPHFVAMLLISALVIHEIGHLITMEASGIPSFMVFLVVLGGAAPLPIKGNVDKLKKLTCERLSVIMLAGVTGNLLMIMGGYFFYRHGDLSWRHFVSLVNLNAIVIFWNTLPVWKFDGHRFTKCLFDSIDTNRDTKYEIGLILVFALLSILMLIITRKFDIFNFVLFLWGIHFQANHHDRLPDKLKIPVSHQVWWAGYYLVLMCLALVLVCLTPTWYK